MAHALPLTKLAGLLMKTFAKPLSKQVKHQLSQYEFGQSILIGIGQFSHQVTSRMTIWSSGYRVRSINPLEEKEAMKAGADFIGETVVVGVSAGILIWEYNRSAESNRKKEEAKQEQAKAERDALTAKLVTLDVRLKALEEVVADNSKSILNIAGKRYHPPKNVVPIQEEASRSGLNDESNVVATDVSEPVRRKEKWGMFGL